LGHGGPAPSLQSALLGLSAGALFGCAAIGYRGGIGALGGSSFVAAATLALAIARLADGADGARFLVHMKRLLENPGLLAL
jgi:pyruvate/2-oxoglutarate dehydrogenase complex dihydrolipoamide acyltransferase (E2) component